MQRNDIVQKIETVLQKHHVRKGAFFGSFARSTDFTDQSDIDILVELPKMDLLDFINLKQELEEVTGRNIDLIQYKTLRPTLRNSILNTAIPLFG